jgi:hypothetical protein
MAAASAPGPALIVSEAAGFGRGRRQPSVGCHREA